MCILNLQCRDGHVFTGPCSIGPFKLLIELPLIFREHSVAYDYITSDLSKYSAVVRTA